MSKLKNSNATYLVLFKHCDTWLEFYNFDIKKLTKGLKCAFKRRICNKPRIANCDDDAWHEIGTNEESSHRKITGLTLNGCIFLI